MVVPSDVFAVTYHVEFSKVDGVAGMKDGEITAKITQDGKAVAGVEGRFSFKKASGNQSCSTPDPVSDSQGQIKGVCSSPMAGQGTIEFILEEQRHEHILTFAKEFPEAPLPTQDSTASASSTATASSSSSSSDSSSIPTSTPSPKPRVSILPTPTPSATPKATPQVSPKPTPSPSQRPSPSPELEKEEEHAAVLSTASSSPQPTSSPEAQSEEEQDDKAANSVDLTWVVLVGGVVIGLGIPVGWFVLESNPTLRGRLASGVRRLRRK